MLRCLLLPMVTVLLLLPAMLVQGQSGETANDQEPQARTALTVEGIPRRSDDRDPRVLYILPWQPPTLPKRPRTELNAEAPTLLEPISPEALERHRHFRQSLDPNLGSALSLY